MKRRNFFHSAAAVLAIIPGLKRLTSGNSFPKSNPENTDELARNRYVAACKAAMATFISQRQPEWKKFGKRPLKGHVYWDRRRQRITFAMRSFKKNNDGKREGLMANNHMKWPPQRNNFHHKLLFMEKVLKSSTWKLP